MIEVENIARRLGGTFENVQVMPKSKVIRAEKFIGESVAGVYFFDCTGTMKKGKELSSFQEDWIAPDYYKHGGYLQWNYYLTQIMEGEVSPFEKYEVERDTTFTRKFVISADELDVFLKFGEGPGADTKGLSDSLYVKWATKLDELGLSDIYQNAKYADITKNIAEGKRGKSDLSKAGSKRPGALVPTAHIRAMEIGKFRDYPKFDDRLELGLVNLFVGPNGSGKTSLLEAIEYIYCGRNRRNDETEMSSASIKVLFDGEKDFREIGNRPASLFVDANSIWYGQTISRAKNLCASFGQYNFFDADKAAEFSRGDVSIEENLSSIALGDEVNSLEDRMTKAIDYIAIELRGAIKAHKEASETLEALKKEEKILGGLLSKRPEDIHEELNAAATNVSFVDKGFLANEKIPQAKKSLLRISELLSNAISEVPWVKDASIELIAKEESKLAAIAKARADFEMEVLKLESFIESQSSKLVRLRNEQTSLRSITKFIKSGYMAKKEEIEKNSAAIESAKTEKKTLEQLQKSKVLQKNLNLSFDELVRENELALKRTDGEVSVVENKLKEVTKGIAEIERMISTIRNSGKELVGIRPDESICPLCGQDHKVGGLAIAIKRTDKAGKKIDGGHEDLMKSLSQIEKKKELHLERKEELKALGKYLRIMDPKGEKKFFGKRLAEVFEFSKVRLNEISVKIESFELLTSKVSALEEQGQSIDVYEELVGELAQMRRVFFDAKNVLNDGLVSKELEVIEGEISECQALSLERKNKLSNMQESFRERLAKDWGITGNTGKRLIEVDERLVAIGDVKKIFVSIKKEIGISNSDILQSVKNNIDSVESWLSKYAAAIENEKKAKAQLEKVAESVGKKKAEVKRGEESIGRLEAAAKGLKKILENDSKSNAMTSFIDENARRIGEVFQKVHSPREFSTVLIQGGDVELQKADGKVRLTEISTGQRAAFALSVFLTLNSNATKAPKIMLIDDPVAHIDDLNILSFFDFLRELVWKQERQVFFATANTRIANLFEMKFKHLGPGFKRVALNRS